MNVYGLNLSDVMNFCEFCGFPCFDDELICPNCGEQRVSLLSDDTSTRDEQLREYHFSYEVLEKTSKRGRSVYILFALLYILYMAVFFFFFSVEDHRGSSPWSDRGSAVLVIFFSVIPYFVLIGFPFMYFTRMRDQPIVKYSRDKDYSVFRRPRGILRFLKDGQVFVLLYIVLIFLSVLVVTLYLMEPFWIENYSIRRADIDQGLYVAVAMGALYVINILMFLFYLFSCLFCPYDYASERESRLKIWRVQHST